MKETNVKKLVLTTKKISLLDAKESNQIKGGETGATLIPKTSGMPCCDLDLPPTN